MSDDEDDSKKPKVATLIKKADVKLIDDMATIEKRAKEVESLISRQMAKDAVAAALADPPFGSKNAEAREKNYRTVIKALNSAKEPEIPTIVDFLYKSQGEVATDALMKYIYRGLSEAESCGVLLKWHGVVVETAGLGPIVRAMTDRRVA